MHRLGLVAACVLAGCGVDVQQPPYDDLAPPPLERVWADSIHPGALIVLVPGTASYDYLPATIEPLGPHPLVDPRVMPSVAADAIVFEQAIAMAHRAGVDPRDLTFGLWGAGFTTLDAFDYQSYEGLRVPIEILGGTNSCARGKIFDNLVNYTQSNAEKDAHALEAAIEARGIPEVAVSAHSWGGAVAEYLAMEVGGTAALTVAAGVPGYVPSYTFAGPGLRDLPGGAMLYETDRPDDPVHAMNPSGNPDGHQYVILYGDEFRGSFGVTTDELSCKTTPGECPIPTP